MTRENAFSKVISPVIDIVNLVPSWLLRCWLQLQHTLQHTLHTLQHTLQQLTFEIWLVNLVPNWLLRHVGSWEWRGMWNIQLGNTFSKVISIVLWHSQRTARSVEDETRNAEFNGNRNPEWWWDFSQLVKIEKIKFLGISRYKVELRFWLDLNSEVSCGTNSNWDFCLIWICSWLKSLHHSGFRLPFNSAFRVSSSTERAVLPIWLLRHTFSKVISSVIWHCQFSTELTLETSRSLRMRGHVEPTAEK